MKILGMISGTSVDGIDAVLVEVNGMPGSDLQVKLIAAHTYPYAPDLRSQILDLCAGQQRSPAEIFKLDLAIAKAFSQSAQNLIAEAQIQPQLIGSHGQTIFHQPPQDGELGFSWQLGRGEAIAHHTKITTISNFRAADIASGGEGAPLVPILDWLLFTDHNQTKSETRCVQNIGGISNVTFLAPGAKAEQVIGFDNAPGNVLIDMATQILFGQQFDLNGNLAAQGQPDLELIQTWLKQDFFVQLPPKSTGRERFSPQYLQDRLAECDHLSSHSILATLTQFTAQAIAHSYHQFLPQFPDRVLICGGGTRNSFLRHSLQAQLQPAIVEPLDNFGINADFKEAIAFAVLAYLRHHQIAVNLANVTGAKQSVVLGELHPVY